jgi:hypothetical protein
MKGPLSRLDFLEAAVVVDRYGAVAVVADDEDDDYVIGEGAVDARSLLKKSCKEMEVRVDHPNLCLRVMSIGTKN